MTEKKMTAKKVDMVIYCKKINGVGYSEKGVLLKLNIVIAKGEKKTPEEPVAMGISLVNAKILHNALSKALDKINQ